MDAPFPRLAPVEASVLALPGIAHAFFTRPGGVSTGLYAGLNTGTGSQDDRAAVLENRARAARHLGVGPEKLVTPYQVHGTEAITVSEPWAPGQGPKADALVTDRPGIAIGVGTADCGPVLFADPEARVVGAAHAGWKGALAGILESTLDAMERLGAERTRIVAVLGPTISAEAYEVGADFRDRFVEAGVRNERFFRSSDRAGHFRFDLPAYIVARLRAAGLRHAESVGLCTYGDEQRFFSFRRATHRSEPDYGRLLAAIAMNER
jgi:YfiH family protein